jgi:hypothetical protein
MDYFLAKKAKMYSITSCVGVAVQVQHLEAQFWHRSAGTY